MSNIVITKDQWDDLKAEFKKIKITEHNNKHILAKIYSLITTDYEKSIASEDLATQNIDNIIEAVDSNQGNLLDELSDVQASLRKKGY